MLNYGKRAFFATFKSIYVDNGSSFFDSVKSGSFLDQALSYGYIKIDPGSPPPQITLKGRDSESKMRFHVILKIPIHVILEILYGNKKKLVSSSCSDASNMGPSRTFHGKRLQKSVKI